MNEAERQAMEDRGNSLRHAAGLRWSKEAPQRGSPEDVERIEHLAEIMSEEIKALFLKRIIGLEIRCQGLETQAKLARAVAVCILAIVGLLVWRTCQ